MVSQAENTVRLPWFGPRRWVWRFVQWLAKEGPREHLRLEPDRIKGLVDAVFGVLMTLTLVGLDFEVRLHLFYEGHLMLPGELRIPLSIYAFTFLIMGLFWVAHSHEFNYIEDSDRNHHWINIGFLLSVAVTPLTATLLSERLVNMWQSRAFEDLVAVTINAIVFGLNLFASQSFLLWNWCYTCSRRQLSSTVTYDEIAIIYTRPVFVLWLYIVSFILLLVSLIPVPFSWVCFAVGLSIYLAHPLLYMFAFSREKIIDRCIPPEELKAQLCEAAPTNNSAGGTS